MRLSTAFTAAAVIPLTLPLELTRGRHPARPGVHFFPSRSEAVMMTSLATALRGSLVITTAAGIVVYLLLTNSHI
jgi:hypothetical protein